MTIDVRRGVEGGHAGATPLIWAWWLTFLASVSLGRAATVFWQIDPDLGISKYGDALRTAAVLAILVVRKLSRLVRNAPVIS